MHLNRSPFGSRLVEEREHDRLPFEIAEMDRSPEHAVAGGAGERKVGRGDADLQRLGRLRLLRRGRTWGCDECRRERRSEEHTSELQSPCNLVCRLLLEKKKVINASQSRAEELAVRNRAEAIGI